MPDFSFCLITKNEEKNITRCLEPLKETGMEIIVLDTGSTDHTVAMARKFTPHLYFFDWINDFSAARNFAMSKASNDYVLFLDADEYVEEIDVPAIQKLIGEYPDAIGRLRRRNICYNTDQRKQIMIDHVERLFNRHIFHYTGKIHEQVTHRKGQKLYAYQLPLTICHDGYLGTIEERRQKAERNNSLLFEELKQNPSDPYLYYQIGQSFGLCNDTEQEYLFYHKGCSLPLDTSLEYVKIMLVSYGYAMQNTGRSSQALKLAGYYNQLSSYADYLCMLGCIYLDNHELLKAIRTFRQALSAKEYHIEGSNNACPWHNLGCIYEALGNYEDALSCYQNAMNYNSPNTKERYETLLQKNGKKNTQKNLSVIIPCCNASAVLDDFFLLLEEQTMGLTHAELIFLDLGSHDDTWNHLSRFERKYPESVMLFRIDTDSFDPCPRTSLDCITCGLAAELLSTYVSAPYLCFINPADRFNMDFFRQYCCAYAENSCDIIHCITTKGALDAQALSEFTSHISSDASYSLLEINQDKGRGQLIASSLLDHPLTGNAFSTSYLSEHNILSPFTQESALACQSAEQLLKARICLSVHSIFNIGDNLYLISSKED